MDILDIIYKLEEKLNIALENEIALHVNQNQVTPLFNGRETFRFKLFIDTADYMGYDYLKRFDEYGGYDSKDLSETPKNKLVRYINGVVSVVDSNVQGGVNFDDNFADKDVNLTFTTNVMFFIPLTSADNDTMELIGTIRNIIDNAMKLNTFAEFSGYNMSIAYSLGRTGERMQRKGVGDSITLNCTIQFGFVESGINSTQIAIRYENSTVYAPSKSLSRVSTQEANVDLKIQDNSAKNTTISTCLTLHFNKPLQNSDIDSAALNYLFTNELNTLEIHLCILDLYGEVEREVVIPMVFNEVSITGENTLNAGLSITMVEAMEV